MTQSTTMGCLNVLALGYPCNIQQDEMVDAMTQATDDGMTTEQVIAGLEKFKSYMIHVEEYKPESLRIFDEAISQLAAVTAERDRLLGAINNVVINDLDAPAGIRELYERGFWEYQELKRLKSKLAGPAYRERMRLRNG